MVIAGLRRMNFKFFPEMANSGILEGEPREVNILDLVRERKEEISDLLAAIQGCSHNAVASESSRKKTHIQRLPRHMRRRAMSHNVKRIPRRLRSMAADSVAATNHKKKPPSRKYRRRPANLLADYIRRQRVGPKWLETHIWHAKRFHMRDLWGYKVPVTSTQRGFRAVYRDSVKRAIVFDLSYHSILQLSGSETHILTGLKRLCSPGVGLTFAAIAWLDGSKAGETVFYARDSYPMKAIGPIKFVWKPKTKSNESRVMWMFVHPAALEEVQQQLLAVFTLKVTNTSDEIVMPKLKTLSQFYQIEPSKSYVYTNEETRVELRSLERQMNYFRLVGPAATRILHNSLVLPTVNQLSSVNKIFNNGSSNQWWNEYYKDPQKLGNFSNELELWNSAYRTETNPAYLHVGTVVTLTVRDPRLRLMNMKAQFEEIRIKSANQQDVMKKEFNGTIWDRAICAAALRTQMSEAELHTRHKDSLGEDISTLTANDSLVPIMLIFTRGRDCRQTSGIGAGWDIVVPGGWGKSFWLLLQYFTARSVGLKDFEHLSLEMGQLSYPSNWPDTNGGAIAAKATHKEKLSVWLKRPPNKRVDYGKLRITSPFSFDWNLLLAEWMSVGQSDSTNFFVLREKWILMKLDDLCKPSTKPSAKNAAQTFFDSLTTTELDNCLVPVEIICHSKGRPKPLSIICIPTQSDLEKFKFPAKIRRCVQPMTNGISAIFEESLGARKKQSKTLQKTAEDSSKKSESLPEFLSFSDNTSAADSEVEIPIEDLFKDRKVEKAERRRAKEKSKAKRKKHEMKNVEDHVIKPQHSEPEKLEIKDSCCRQVIGTVCSGDYSFLTAKGKGVGYVTFLGLKKLLLEKSSMCGSTILYRNTTSRCYRSAKLYILT